MELIERYLQAVKFWLPKHQQDDITAELREDLQSRIDERQQELGRTLTETEVATVLEQTGRPVMVASRYRPQRSLIGPVLFPIYLFVLKIIALCYFLPWAVLLFTLMTVSRTYHDAHPWGQSLLSAWSTLWSFGLAIFGATTVLFAILERAQAQSRFLEKWSPLKLPPLRNSLEIKRSASIAEIIANLIFAVWWIDGFWFHAVAAPYVHLTLAPIWRSLYLAFILIAAVNIALATMHLFRPYWTKARAYVRLGLDCAGSALFCWLLKAHLISAIIAPDVSTARAAALVSAINAALAQAFPYAVALCFLIVGICNLPRIFKLSNQRPQHATTIPAAA